MSAKGGRFGPRLKSSSFFWNRSLREKKQTGAMKSGELSASIAHKDHHGPAHPLIERALSWLHATFPERQIYIRSDGRVQFFTFSSSLQATLAGLSLIFLCWIAFSTVNVVFKDRIIAAKDHRYQSMQATYENRVANLQLSYDELNDALVSAEDKFKATANELEAKHDTLARLIGRKQAIDASFGGNVNYAVSPSLRGASGDGAASDSVGSDAPVQNVTPMTNVLPTVNGNGSELSILPQPTDPQPRTAGPTRASLYDLGAALFRFFRSAVAPRHVTTPAHIANRPALRFLAEETARLQRISADDDAILAATETSLASRVNGMEKAIRVAGINPGTMESRAGDQQGGPLLPLSAMKLDGVQDPVFQNEYWGASATMAQLSALAVVMRHVPLTPPISGAGVELTSDFGPRIDPFTGHAAFHPGIDFGGPYGSAVHATAAGTVVWAGPRGPYGNMVEVDHGMGIHTRYAHLSAVLVGVGMRVNKGSQVGRLGSTGRSTGPHVHYEVWLDNSLRDPARFLEAGHVLQQN
jgi:murein DD-endopeptidase MepM/ murein hydrolase activator NlpD